MLRSFALVLLAAPAVTTVQVQAQQAASFTLSSSDVKEGARIPDTHAFNGMGCTGGNISPDLEWSGAPAAAKSFALTVYDPDAPTGSGFWHWVVYNIPVSVTKLAAGVGDPAKNLLPAGIVQGNTDIGKPGYVGPCPPKGDKPHHYQFTLFALDVDRLDIPAGATAAIVGFNLHFHTLGTARLTAIYDRP